MLASNSPSTPVLGFQALACGERDSCWHTFLFPTIFVKIKGNGSFYHFLPAGWGQLLHLLSLEAGAKAQCRKHLYSLEAEWSFLGLFRPQASLQLFKEVFLIENWSQHAQTGKPVHKDLKTRAISQVFISSASHNQPSTNNLRNKLNFSKQK